jgi:hypothetical protein
MAPESPAVVQSGEAWKTDFKDLKGLCFTPSAMFRNRRSFGLLSACLPLWGNDYDTAGRAGAKEPKTWYNTVNQEGWSGMDE